MECRTGMFEGISNHFDSFLEQFVKNWSYFTVHLLYYWDGFQLTPVRKPAKQGNYSLQANYNVDKYRELLIRTCCQHKKLNIRTRQQVRV